MTEESTEEGFGSSIEKQIATAKREIGALHLLLATMIGDGNTAYIKKSAIAAGGKALKMSDDDEHFILEVVDIPTEDSESVV